MDSIKLEKMKQTWHQIARNHSGDIPPSFELTIYKKLLELFHVGRYYYYVFNTATANIEFVSEEFSSILGHPTNTFNVDWAFENIHPDDKQRFIAHEHTVTDFFTRLPPEKVLKYKVSYDYRLRCADGSYKWLLQQVTTVQTDDIGSVIRVLGVHTEITHLKTDDKPSGLSFIGLEGEPSYLNVPVNSPHYLLSNELFSKREKEVLQLVLSGKNSTEIGQQLYISKHTVDTHRKNILSKSGCANLAELISKAIQNGWV